MFPDPAAVAVAAADQVLAWSREALSRQPWFSIALSGGSTPRLLYQQLTARAETGDFSRWQVFFGDERSVPADHADSNYRMAREALLDASGIPAAQIHRLAADRADRDAAAAAYEGLLRRLLPAPGNVPRLDLVLLGMGDDGHTASLFPGTRALEETERLVVANHVPTLRTWRLTFTLPLLAAAHQILFLICGESKRQRLAEAAREPRPGAAPLPVQRVEGAPCAWFLDRAAAADLT